ncbi:MAG: cell division protein ZapA [Gammaproteobacteria bacterium]|jgi:cell division protein ZapA|nr:cell division protein ZapA [Gammaproteobacteria bacterium]MBU0770360.1 cell division protein ZapA [Gammaproteobacteria bacterium]MBU0858033.1 cell division protein ZapA [Gammaproteobacteria bacterium]MBU1847877.1 cell division protein ZapA [Gammaproteobacteria bacterium]
MTRESEFTEITLLGREYRVQCREGERDALNASVELVERRMRDLAESTRASGERLAVMCALNLAHEIFQVQATGGVDLVPLRRRINAMQSRIDEALSSQEKLF